MKMGTDLFSSSRSPAPRGNALPMTLRVTRPLHRNRNHPQSTLAISSGVLYFCSIKRISHFFLTLSMPH